MDKFSRNYSMGLGVICLVIVVTWLANFSLRTNELNKLLRDAPFLADYPYQFRVISFDNGLAEMSTPRSSAMPAIKFLTIIYPDLKDKASQDSLMIEAQKELADRQAHAKKLILQQSDVLRVEWALDRDWYSKHDIYMDPR